MVENQQHHPLIKHGDGQSYTHESVYRKQICKHIKQKYWLCLSTTEYLKPPTSSFTSPGSPASAVLRPREDALSSPGRT